MKKCTNITKGLTFSFCFLIATLLIYGIYSIYEVKQVARLTRTIYNHPLVVSNAALQAKASVTKMHLNMKDIVLFYSRTRSEQLIEAVNDEEQKVYKQLDIIRNNILGDEGRALESNARNLFDEWRSIRNEVIQLVKQNRLEEAANITVGKGARHVAKLTGAVEKMTNYALGMASKFVKQADKVNENATTITVVFLLISIAIAAVVAVLTVKKASAAAEMLRKSEQLFRTIFEQAPLGIAMIDSNTGKIHEANNRFAEITGRSIEGLSKIDWMSFADQDDVRADLSYMSLLSTRKIQGYDLEQRYIRPNGSLVWVNVTVTDFETEDTTRPFHLRMIEDITERKQTEEALKIANEGLEQQSKKLKFSNEELEQKAEDLANASRYKTEFLANMSHELRSPLNSLLLLVGCLADNREGNLTPDQKEQIRVIQNSGTELLYLISDILDLSKVEVGQMDINESVINLEPFCNSLGTAFAMQAAEKGLDFRVSCDSSVPQFLISDEQRLRQIIKNLISNALKFTTKGSVVMTVKAAGKDNIAFVVQDSGIGISSANKHEIFEAFCQADGSTTRKYGGTGLGLAISRKLIGLLGGTIEVESEEGRGSVFTVLLPMKKAMDVSKYQKEEQLFAKKNSDNGQENVESNYSLWDQQFQQKLIGKTILVVDDDMRNTFAIGALLKKAGMTVFLAGDGRQAIEKLSENSEIDLVLMDIMMPNMDGYEAISRIRSMDGFEELPVIAVTAKAMVEDREKCLNVGASDYLSKPVDAGLLFEMMSEMITRKH